MILLAFLQKRSEFVGSWPRLNHARHARTFEGIAGVSRAIEMRGFGEGPVADCLWIGDIFSDEGGPTENSLAGGFLTVKIKSFRFGFEGGIEFIVDCAVFDIEETPGRVGQRS
jgi:hypothetical protein